MPKTLTAQEQSLSKIFSDDYVFHIPGYQRPYAWTTEPAGELIDDLLSFMQASGGPVQALGSPPDASALSQTRWQRKGYLSGPDTAASYKGV